MEHVQFGRTGLKVSRLCLGTMTFGYQTDESTSNEIMDTAAEAGFTFFDTADVYPLGAPAKEFGRTEEVIGSWMSGKRDRLDRGTHDSTSLDDRRKKGDGKKRANCSKRLVWGQRRRRMSLFAVFGQLL